MCLFMALCRFFLSYFCKVKLDEVYQLPPFVDPKILVIRRMKTETTVIGYLSLFALCLILLVQTQTASQQFWGEIIAPSGEQQLNLYQKDRSMHQTPEILLYSQRNNSTVERYLGCISLPEDNRNAIHYTYEWANEEELVLSLECDYCMVSKRRYQIALAAKTPHCITAIPFTP